MSEERREDQELSADELMAQQFENMGDGDEQSESPNPDELMAQQYAQQSYAQSEENLEEFSVHTKAEESKLSLLLDIPLEVTVEIGATQMKIEEVLKLNPNSVIELDRYVNEPIDLKVNGRVIAKGELYTIKNNFGIRITHIITPEDRLKILEG